MLRSRVFNPRPGKRETSDLPEVIVAETITLVHALRTAIMNRFEPQKRRLAPPLAAGERGTSPAAK